MSNSNSVIPRSDLLPTQSLLQLIQDYFTLSTTPSYHLSTLIDSERTSTSFSSLLSRLLTQLSSIWSEYILGYGIRTALEREEGKRGISSSSTTGSGKGAISANTLRIVDSAYYKTTLDKELKFGGHGGYERLTSTPIYDAEELAERIALSEGISLSDPVYQTLLSSLPPVLHTYTIVAFVMERSEVQYGEEEGEEGEGERGEDEENLRELWRILKPDKELEGMEGKWWQEIGFQGTSPPTDFRSLGILALDSYLHFARTYKSRAAEIVQESVEGGRNWYPLALASIHMTNFCLEMGMARDLQLPLLRSLQTYTISGHLPTFSSSSSSFSSSNPLLSSTSVPPNPQRRRITKEEREELLEPFFRISTELLILFHTYWKQGDWNVMQFEMVSKSFKEKVRPWIRRGILDRRALGLGSEGGKED